MRRCLATRHDRLGFSRGYGIHGTLPIIAFVGKDMVGLQPFEQPSIWVISLRSPPVRINRIGLPKASVAA